MCLVEKPLSSWWQVTTTFSSCPSQPLVSSSSWVGMDQVLALLWGATTSSVERCVGNTAELLIRLKRSSPSHHDINSLIFLATDAAPQQLLFPSPKGYPGPLFAAAEQPLWVPWCTPDQGKSHRGAELGLVMLSSPSSHGHPQGSQHLARDAEQVPQSQPSVCKVNPW